MLENILRLQIFIKRIILQIKILSLLIILLIDKISITIISIINISIITSYFLRVLNRTFYESILVKTTNDIINVITKTKKDRFPKLEICLMLIYSVISQRRSFFKMNFEEFNGFGIMSQQAKSYRCAPMHCLQICKTCTGLPCLPLCGRITISHFNFIISFL